MFSTVVLPATPAALQEAANLIQVGQVVAMPTETVYGLAASLWSETGLTRIFESKARPLFDPLIVHLSPEMAADPCCLATLIDESALSTHWQAEIQALKQAFWPGPLTLVLPKTAKIPDLATSGLPSLALRLPAHPVAQALIQISGVPLAAPSANRFGRISPTSAQAVYEELAGRIPLILDGGPCAVGLESTVLGWNEAGQPQILRPGQISKQDIEAVLARAVLEAVFHPAEIQAPGMLKNHYAPRKPLFLLPAGWQPGQALPPVTLSPEAIAPGKEYASLRAGYLLLSGQAEVISAQLQGPVVTLSPEGERDLCARNLFAALRTLDASNADLLWAELPMDTSGLGYAIANRLRKAAGI